MNIAIFSDSYYPSIDGVVTQITNMSREFTRLGHRVLVVAPSHSAKFEETGRDGAKVLLLPSIALPTYKDYRIAPPHSGRVLKKLGEFKPDIVHVQTPFGVGWLGLRYGKRLHVPVIGTYHTLISEFLVYLPIPFLKNTGFAKAATWKYTALFYNKCDMVTTPTPRMKEELERNGVKNVRALSNAIDFERFSKARKKKRRAGIRLIYFGRVAYEKNIEVLLFALRHVLKRDGKASLTITGDGPALEYLKKLAHGELKMGSHVEFTGKVTGEKLAELVAAHDALVTASTIETQGLTILEAMAAGLPCIGADYMAIPDAVKDGKNGFLFRPFDFGDLAAKIEKLESSPALRKRLSQNAVKAARGYTAEKIAEETLGLYRKAIAGQGKKVRRK